MLLLQKSDYNETILRLLGDTDTYTDYKKKNIFSIQDNNKLAKVDKAG